ncbi:MAG: hypothetical protein F6K39_30280 [Okeania sp. SIO3B3]|nr:hypothetical protein [Okeania sp. SIO3B3]
MSGLFDILGFTNCFDPSDFPGWGEDIWYSYEALYLSSDFAHSENCLERAEYISTKATYSYIEEGMAYNAIKVYKLYKKLGFKSFKEYCVQRLKKTAWRVGQIIEAARTAWNLMVNGFEKLPSNVSQAYALYEPLKKKSCDYDLETAWQDILHTSEKESKPITTMSIEATVSPDKKKMGSKIKLPDDVMAVLRETAKKKGQNLEDLAAEIITEYFAVEYDPGLDTEIDDFTAENSSDSDTETASEPELKKNKKGCMLKSQKIQVWEADLEALIQERNSDVFNNRATTGNLSTPEAPCSDKGAFPGGEGQLREPPS